jgi:predicted PurR-regulated permease PerM
MQRNKKAQNIGGIIEVIIGITFFIAVFPILFKLADMSNPEPKVVVDQTAIEQAKNLSEQLKICQKNYEELNKTILTKSDLIDLTKAVGLINKNVINIYETNQNYIKNYFSFTVILSLSLGFTLSISLFTLIDWTIFKFELRKSLFDAIKRRFNK